MSKIQVLVLFFAVVLGCSVSGNSASSQTDCGICGSGTCSYSYWGWTKEKFCCTIAGIKICITWPKWGLIEKTSVCNSVCTIGPCNVTCGGGQQLVMSTCLDDDNKCDPVENTFYIACNTQACPDGPIDGVWSQWSDWSPIGECDCDVGQKNKTRTRSCTDPPPSNGGADCEGDSSEVEFSDCEEEECEPDTDPCQVTCQGTGPQKKPCHTKCRKYIHCGEDGSYKNIRCPAGTLFNTVANVCDHAEFVHCGNEPCGDEDGNPIADGNYVDPDNCRGFIACSNGRGIPMDCALGTIYNPDTRNCDIHEDGRPC